jgi:large subunit ribosomal protein L28
LHSLKNSTEVTFYNLKYTQTMSRICQITGKKPITGNRVSHSNIKSKRKFLPNLQYKRFFLPEEGQWITLRVSSKAIRIINKKGIYAVLKQVSEKGVY